MPAPFDGEVFRFTNPDGSEISVRGWGNQFHAVFETLDGYTVVKDPDSGFYQYAVLSEDRSELRPSGARVGRSAPQALGLPRHVRAPRATARSEARAAHDEGPRRRWEVRREQRRARRRSQGAPEAGPEADPEPAAPVGDYVGLCLLVQFPDVQATITRDEVDAFCNQTGYAGFGNNGSVHDYFLDVSDGKLRYTNEVTDYYTAKHDRSHYTDPAVPFGTRARELILEALDSLKGSGHDFSALTSDSADLVYALNVFYAGPRVNAWSEGLWPHQWSLAAPYPTPAGTSLYDYQITDMGTQLTLRTFCHENGHMVCSYPDLYDYGNESYGVGHYSLMCYGGSDTNPTHVDAYLKNEASWTSKLTPVPAGSTVTVHAGTNDFLVHSRNADEYFILENRQQAGRDASLPDAGLAIWHVDETGSNSNEQMTPAQHYELSLEQADNRFDLERRVNPGDTEDLFGGPSAPGFGSGTAPASTWWDGTASGLEIEEVSTPGPGIDVRTKGAAGDGTSIVGSWAVVGVDWGCTGTVATAGPFTFHADGTWSYAFGGGRWAQVGDTVVWDFTNAPHLVYSAGASASAMSGVMCHLTAGGGTGCFYALRTPAPTSIDAIAAALSALLRNVQAADGGDVVTPTGVDVAACPHTG
ncbi:M6 family metalloprotease domain-containing protein [Geodermatophilus sp. SYSU D00742]